MDMSLSLAIVSAVLLVFMAIAVLRYYMKRKEEARMRKVRFQRYREFMTSILDVVRVDETPDARERFSHAVRTVQRVAPGNVLGALNPLKEEVTRIKPRRSPETRDELLSHLVQEMRVDLGANHALSTAEITLWTTERRMGERRTAERAGRDRRARTDQRSLYY